MEHVVVPNMPATGTPGPNSPPAPILIEVSPNAQEEEIVEITSTGSSTMFPPMILKPYTEDLDLSPTMPADLPRVAVIDLGVSKVPTKLPAYVTDLEENIKVSSRFTYYSDHQAFTLSFE